MLHEGCYAAGDQAHAELRAHFVLWITIDSIEEKLILKF